MTNMEQVGKMEREIKALKKKLVEQRKNLKLMQELQDKQMRMAVNHMTKLEDHLFKLSVGNSKKHEVQNYYEDKVEMLKNMLDQKIKELKSKIKQSKETAHQEIEGLTQSNEENLKEAIDHSMKFEEVSMNGLKMAKQVFDGGVPLKIVDSKQQADSLVSNQSSTKAA